MPRESVLCAYAVHECPFGFQCRTRETAPGIAGWIKHKGSASSQRVRLQPGKSRQFDYRFAGDLVDVGLDARRCATEIELCVAVVAVVRLGREPPIEVVAIADQKTACVVGAFDCAVAGRVLRKKSGALDTNF